MILQALQFPNYDTCSTYEMYFRMNEDDKRSYYIPEERAVHMKSWQYLYFDTYFNSFSAAKWRKYTNLQNLKLRLELKGAFRIQIMHKFVMNKNSFMNVFEEHSCRLEERATLEFDIPFKSFERGIVCFTLETMDFDDNVYYGGCYVTDVDEAALNDVNIAIDICTFKRETFVERNIALLNREIIENPDNPVNGHLDVFVSDNGRTLDVEKLQSDRVHIFPNKNVGGAGGFARGMIEILNKSVERAFSHALVMDDDVLINTDAILRTYRLLQFIKPEYAGKTIAGAMLRLDNRSMQHECGGMWDGDEVHPCNTFLDMSDIDKILINDNEDEPDYNAWWYSCIPMRKITNENLPLPIFIRFDDVEFGLRTGSDILSMNGICLWHEPFEYKYSSSMEYYHMRNGLIVDSLRLPDSRYGGKAAAAHMKRMIRSNLVRYRYNNCELIFRAVDDFLKGAEFLLKTDGEALHKEIMAAADKFVSLDKLDVQFDDTKLQDSFEWDENRLQYYLRVLTFNGLFFPAKGTAVVDATVNAAKSFNRKSAVLNYDVSGNRGFVTRRDFKRTISTLMRANKVARRLAAMYSSIREEYRAAEKTLTSRAFWNKYLNL